jgi:hypothetical protein
MFLIILEGHVEVTTAMKKALGIVLAVFLVIGLSGPASAAIPGTKGDLIVVAYEETDNALPISQGGNESYFNLGFAGSVNYSDTGQINTGITLGDFGATDWSDIYVGIYGGGFLADGLTVGAPYFGSVDSGFVLNPGAYGSYTSAVGNIQNGADGTKANSNSYINQMDVGGNNPSYATYLTSMSGPFGPEAQMNGGAVLMDMYTSPDAASKVSLASWTLDTSSGELVINPVPVPGAVLLFGTGLLGFFGIRRKKQ